MKGHWENFASLLGHSINENDDLGIFAENFKSYYTHILLACNQQEVIIKNIENKEKIYNKHIQQNLGIYDNLNICAQYCINYIKDIIMHYLHNFTLNDNIYDYIFTKYNGTKLDIIIYKDPIALIEDYNKIDCITLTLSYINFNQISAEPIDNKEIYITQNE